jgi:hypothetical protein
LLVRQYQRPDGLSWRFRDDDSGTDIANAIDAGSGDPAEDSIARPQEH